MADTRNTVVAINWTEYERGWGSRPDGHTFHLTFEAANDYITKYWARQPDKKNGVAPDEYSAPGEPFSIEVDGEIFQKLVNSGDFWGHHSNWV